jgi:hypothetical protein
MRRRDIDRTGERTRVIPAAMIVSGLLLIALVLALPDHASRAAPSRHIAAPFARAVVTIPSLTPQRHVPKSFLGLSTEYWTLPVYARHLGVAKRVLSVLRVRGDGPLLLRIGGDSADHVDWDPRGRALPPWQFAVTRRWLSDTRRLVEATRLPLILDLNLLTSSPPAAAQWARIALHTLPRRSVVALEIGNEPDIYDRTWWRAVVARSGASVRVLPRDLTSAGYVRDFNAYSRRLAQIAPDVPLAGPALANPGVHDWWIARLLHGPHLGLGLITAHRYPFGACSPPWARNHPTIARILSARATAGMARSVDGGVELAHRAGLPFRLTELNSVTCGGLRGVSNAFATALWAPDALFQLLRAGVDGVNIHVREYVHVRGFAINAPFALSDRGLQARPLLYGLILFDRMLGPNARLLHAQVTVRPRLHLEAWAVRVRGRTHVLLIDKAKRAVRVSVHVPGQGPATLERMLAPSASATSGVTLAGQRLTATGAWAGRPVIARIRPGPRGYRLTIPPSSVALLSVR